MLVRPHDAPADDAEWRAFLRAHDFGQLLAPGAGREMPVVVPTHFVFDGRDEVILHVARDNPVLDALRERPRAMLAVVADYVYVPTAWNARPGSPPEWGVPTSYYAAVQAAGDVEVVEDHASLARLLAAQLAHFQPEGGHRPVEAGANPYGAQLGHIRGVRLAIREVRAKFKYGGNKAPEHRRLIAERLAARGRPLDLAARDRLLADLARSAGGQAPNVSDADKAEERR